MPPPLSESSEGEEDIPFRGKEDVGSSVEPEDQDVARNDEDDEEEDEYIVEAILQHKFLGDELQFQVKWQGFDEKGDLTWEPEDNLSGAMEVLRDYFKSIGGRPENTKGKKRKGRKSTVIEKSEAATPVSSSKRVKKEREWSPPPGSWENEVDYVDTVEQGSQVNEKGELEKYAYMVWKNGKKSQHPLAHVYLKCPQKMLVYYESHLVFTTPTEAKALNGEDDEHMDQSPS